MRRTSAWGRTSSFRGEDGKVWNRRRAGTRTRYRAVGSCPKIERVALGCQLSFLSLWPPDEAKIETEHEEDEMDDGAASADLGCFDKTRPQQRHRNIGEIEIEQNAG